MARRPILPDAHRALGITAPMWIIGAATAAAVMGDAYGPEAGTLTALAFAAGGYLWVLWLAYLCEVTR